MRLFAYYVLHTFKNQLKKLFKTWVLIFLVVCMVLGGVIGLITASVEDGLEEDAPTDSATQEYDDYEYTPEDLEDLQDALPAEAMDIVELAAGAVVLGVLVYMAFSANSKGINIFLPADVPLLFASPMRPQSVLMFRLSTRLSLSVLGSLYLLFQLPNLVLNVGMSLWAALALIAAWCLTLVVATLVQVLLYLISSSYPGAKPHVRRGIYLLLALILAGYVISLQRSGGDYLTAAVRYFNAGVSRWIPLWGWLKGFCRFAVEGNLPATLGCLAAVLLGVALLLWLIHHIKADFYEDAMAKSEEVAELLERAQSEKSSGIVVRRKKDRSEKLRREGLDHGNGANVFFFKTMYNRFRFAHLGFFTKTMEFYLVAALGVGAICRFAVKTTSAVPVALTLAGLAFFRSLGNPLEQDTNMDYFKLIPENTWAKLFWSLMGGSANCALDALLPLLIGAVLVGANPLLALVWIPFIVSVDFYATNVGAFIGFSVPVAAGKTIKQVVQIMFVYFGLLPDIAILVFGMLFGHAALAVILSAVLNMALGFLFFALSPLFLDPLTRS